MERKPKLVFLSALKYMAGLILLSLLVLVIFMAYHAAQ